MGLQHAYTHTHGGMKLADIQQYSTFIYSSIYLRCDTCALLLLLRLYRGRRNNTINNKCCVCTNSSSSSSSGSNSNSNSSRRGVECPITTEVLVTLSTGRIDAFNALIDDLLALPLPFPFPSVGGGGGVAVVGTEKCGSSPSYGKFVEERRRRRRSRSRVRRLSGGGGGGGAMLGGG